MLRFAASIVFALFAAAPAASQCYDCDLTDRGGAWIQVAAASDYWDAGDRAQEFVSDYPNTRVFLTDVGAYAIVIDAEERRAARGYLLQEVAAGRIPADSFLRSGAAFVEEVHGPVLRDAALWTDDRRAVRQRHDGFDGYLVQVASLGRLDAALDLADDMRGRFPGVRVLRNAEGFYAVIVAHHPTRAAADAALESARRRGAPDGAFIRPGDGYLVEISVDG